METTKQKFRYAHRITLALWLMVICGWLLSEVHKQMPLRSQPEEFGWLPCIGGIVLFLVTALLGFLAAKEYFDE